VFVLKFVEIWFYFFSILIEWFHFIPLFVFLSSLSTVKSLFSVPFNTQNFTSRNKNCCYQNCLNMNHHLRNNSGRRLIHRLHLVIRHLVKQ
jgi:hypothetical protein